MASMLKMIAERAGVSMSTASQILNRRPNDFSSEETKRRVRAIACELGYKQNFGHKLLRGDKTHTVAILLGMHRIRLEEPIQMLQVQLQDKLELRGNTVYMRTLTLSETNNLALIRDLFSRGVDSFIFLGDPVGGKALEEEIFRQGHTLVGFNTRFSRNIGLEVGKSTEEILRFFLAEGRSHFRFFGGHEAEVSRFQALCRLFPDQSPESVKEQYYVDLGALGEIDDIDIFSELGYQKTLAVLDADPGVKALYYLSDYFAIGGVKALHDRGLVPGRDILVAGFNDIHAVRNNIYPISSGRHDINEISNFLVDEANKTEEIRKISLPKTIIRKD